MNAASMRQVMSDHDRRPRKRTPPIKRPRPSRTSTPKRLPVRAALPLNFAYAPLELVIPGHIHDRF
jgi:hypothetical protein